ncbi:MAG: OmpA family protein [Pseudomonadota bacterium]
MLCLALPVRAEVALRLPAGASETARVEEPLARHLLPTARFTPDFQPGLALEGRVLIRAWRMPLDVQAPLSVFRQLREQISAADFRILHDCSDVACGGYDFVFKTRVLPPPDMQLDLGDFHYLSAAARAEEGLHIGLLVSRGEAAIYVQLSEVTEAAAAAPEAPVAVAPAAAQGDLGALLAEQGRAVLEGIAFEPGRAALAEGSAEALRAVATLLEADPALDLMIVGHSDNSGSLVANIRVSEARAEAVRAALVRDFGVPAERLSAVGAGFMAPLLANDSEEARARNRRVEIVAR